MKRDPLLILVVGNVRRAGPEGCTLGWLVNRINAGESAIAKALGLQVQAGLMTEAKGVYRIVEGTTVWARSKQATTFVRTSTTWPCPRA